MQTLKELDMIDKKINNVVEIDDLPNFDEKQSLLPDVEELMKVREEKKEKENPKNYLKKTVKRKFTLGKSDKLYNKRYCLRFCIIHILCVLFYSSKLSIISCNDRCNLINDAKKF